MKKPTIKDLQSKIIAQIRDNNALLKNNEALSEKLEKAKSDLKVEESRSDQLAKQIRAMQIRQIATQGSVDALSKTLLQ